MNASAADIYPWQQTRWDACMARLREGKLPHALLLHGETGTGVGDFSERLVGALLCSGDDKPCGHCRACRLREGGNHPDFCEVAAEKEGGDIKVSQIRDLLSFLQIARHYSAFKTVLIRDADAMNRAAANSLLKMLEEPPANTVMVLTSRHPFRLPATVRSRCQTVRLSSPDRQQAGAWLAAACDINEDEAAHRLAACLWRPIHALAAARADADSDTPPGRDDFRKDIGELLAGQANPAELIEKWQGQPVAMVHQWLLEAAEEAIRGEFQVAGAAGRGLPLRKLFSFYDRQKYRCLSIKINLNPRLLLESALIEWQLVCAASK